MPKSSFQSHGSQRFKTLCSLSPFEEMLSDQLEVAFGFVRNCCIRSPLGSFALNEHYSSFCSCQLLYIINISTLLLFWAN